MSVTNVLTDFICLWFNIFWVYRFFYSFSLRFWVSLDSSRIFKFPNQLESFFGAPGTKNTCNCFTFCLGAVIILFTEKLLVLHQVELVPSVKLPVAENTHEAVHVIYIVLGSSHNWTRSNSLATSWALGSVLPEEIFSAEHLVVLHEALVSERLGAGAAAETLGVPWLVNNLEDEPVQDHSSTWTTLWYRRWK